MNDPICTCFSQPEAQPWPEVTFHGERQDTSCVGWLRLLDLIEEAAADGREEFAPLESLSREERSQIITLPASIAKLTAVREFTLYRSHLVRIPPEIGAMTSLEIFTPYTSWRLHWFPYEITRCANLRESTVSTRALYGNYKFRPPFPRLQPGRVTTAGLELASLPPEIWGAPAITTCSVCNCPLETTGLFQAWISLPVATDVLPLLVNACSTACLSMLPIPPDDYIQEPHMGGPEIRQPAVFYLSNELSLPIMLNPQDAGYGHQSDYLEHRWKAAEDMGAEVSTIEERGDAIGDQIHYAIVSASIRSKAAQLPPALPAAQVLSGFWTPETALAWVSQIPLHEGTRAPDQWADALVLLMPVLPAPLRTTAFNLVRTLGDDLPTDGESPTLAAHQQTKGSLRTRTLARLLPHLESSEQRECLLLALEGVPSYSREWSLRELCADLAPYLTLDDVRELITVANQLPAFYQAMATAPRLDTLIVLAPRLAALGDAKEAARLIAASYDDAIKEAAAPEQHGGSFTYESRVRLARERSAHAILRLARQRPPHERDLLIAKVRDIALSLPLDWFYAVRLLVDVAAYQVEIGANNEALATTSMIPGPGNQLCAQAGMLQHLPPAEAQALVTTMCDKLEGLKNGLTVSDKEQIFIPLALHLARQGRIDQAFEYMAKLPSFPWERRATYLTQLVPPLIHLGYGNQLLDFAYRWTDDVAFTLAYLAVHLPADLRAAACRESMSRIGLVDDEDIQSWTLSRYAHFAASTLRIEAATRVLDLGDLATNQWSAGFPVFEDSSPHWIAALADLIRLAPLLPQLLQARIQDARSAVEAGIQADDEESQWIPQNLAQADQEQQPASVSADDYQRDPAIRWLGPKSARGLIRFETDPIAAGLTKGSGYRALQLINLLPTLLHEPPEALYPVWCQMLRQLAQRPREDLLTDLRILYPLIARIGGETALTGTLKSMLNISCCFA